MTIRVALADDQQLIRAGFRSLLEAEPDLEVVGEAADGLSAVEQARRLKPDVVLMDIRMPELDGIEATRRVLAEAGQQPVRVLMLTTFDLNEYVYEALRAGASGFLLKDASPDQILAAIRAVAAGDMLFAPAVTRRLVEAFAPPAEVPPVPALTALTERETQVVRLVGHGMSNAEIAGRLTVSAGTVKTHLNRAMGKLGVSSRAQAVVVAYESGLVVPGAGSRYTGG